MPLEVILAAVILGTLTFYVLLGGADFGAGVWHLFARGPKAELERTMITDAIGPIWEANHVWLIAAVTILFTAFPPAYALISTALHIPLTLLLVGIVLRGSAFAFRHYDIKHDSLHIRWDQLFAVASLLTPIVIGITMGTIAAGNLRLHGGSFVEIFVLPWVQPFPLAVGAFALVLFAYLASVYLAVEAHDEDVRETFRRRALVSALAAGFLEQVVVLLARTGAPQLSASLQETTWGGLAQLGTATACFAAIFCLWQRAYWWARLSAVAQVVLTIWTWGLAQYPYMVPPNLTIAEAASPPLTLQIVTVVICAGAFLLVPSLYCLFRVFKYGYVLGSRRREPVQGGVRG